MPSRRIVIQVRKKEVLMFDIIFFGLLIYLIFKGVITVLEKLSDM